MDYVVVALSALFVSALTLFSGFGLGTILMPVFAIFFPVSTAIAATALVHFANDIFKVVFVGRRADWPTVLRFGLPAAAAAVVGALILARLSGLPVWLSYNIGGRSFFITPVKLVIAVLIVGFALFEMSSRFRSVSIDKRFLPLGGVLSGFFGGLSGHQGALRSMFLVKGGLSTASFVGTVAVSAALVDTTRLMVYGTAFLGRHFFAIGSETAGLIWTGIVAAFIGTFTGSRFIHKVTFSGIRTLVAVMLLVLGLALGAGLV